MTVLEKNEKAGKKIYITGKGRCNITNACDVEELFNNVVTNKKFLYSAFYGFTNDDVVAMLNTAGLATKVERGNRVFPVSDRAGDVIAALVRIMINAILRSSADIPRILSSNRLSTYGPRTIPVISMPSKLGNLIFWHIHPINIPKIRISEILNNIIFLLIYAEKADTLCVHLLAEGISFHKRFK